MFRIIFRKDLSLLWLANLLLLAAYTVQGVLLPLWIQQLGFREGVNGFILGLTSLGLLAGLLTLGPRIDTGDPRAYMAAGCMVWALTSALLYFFAYLPVMGFCRFLQGIGYASFYTAALVYATRSVPVQMQGAVIGMIEAVGALAIALTPFGAIGLQIRFGYSLTIAASGSLSLLAGLICISLNKISALKKEKHTLAPPHLLNSQAVLPGIVGGALFLVAVAYVNLAPLIAQQLQITNLSLYLAARAFATVPTRILSGIIADKKGPSYAIIPGYILAVIAIAGLPVLIFPGWAYVVPIAFGLGMGLASPSLVQWMLRRIQPGKHATAYNTYSLITEGSGFFGSWMVGISLQTGNLTFFWLLAALIGLGLCTFVILRSIQNRNAT